VPLPNNPKKPKPQMGARMGLSVSSEAELIDLLKTNDPAMVARLNKLWPRHAATKITDGMMVKADLPFPVRSNWEANVSRWMRHHEILHDYEMVRVPLPGMSAYVPDFWVSPAGIWIEVKGLWMAGAKAKVRQFIAEYPDQKLIVLDRAYYRMLTPVEGWE